MLNCVTRLRSVIRPVFFSFFLAILLLATDDKPAALELVTNIDSICRWRSNQHEGYFFCKACSEAFPNYADRTLCLPCKRFFEQIGRIYTTNVKVCRFCTYPVPLYGFDAIYDHFDTVHPELVIPFPFCFIRILFIVWVWGSIGLSTQNLQAQRWF